MLEPFYAKLYPPHTKFAGAGGVPLDEQLWPESVEEVIAMISQEHEPRSFVLHLEELEAAPPPFAEMLEPFLPLNDMTAHVYVSNQGASALKNHTDVTEILVLQLLGRKEWLYCRGARSPSCRGCLPRQARSRRSCPSAGLTRATRCRATRLIAAALSPRRATCSTRLAARSTARAPSAMTSRCI